MHFYERRLTPAGSPGGPAREEEQTESIREQAADLSSRALEEGMSDGSLFGKRSWYGRGERGGHSQSALSAQMVPRDDVSDVEYTLPDDESDIGADTTRETDAFLDRETGGAGTDTGLLPRRSRSYSHSSRHSRHSRHSYTQHTTDGYNTFASDENMRSAGDLLHYRQPRPSTWRRLRKWARERNLKEEVLKHGIEKPVRYLPSVLLGTLLNVLDGLSYGMILFPLQMPVFSELGPAGLSMFYVSCIVSQLVFSLGGSAFRAGIGSEMIEVVPFFHGMAATIVARVGEDNPQTVIATTIVSFAISTVVTGLVFFLLGYLRLGSLIEFFPRHILVGCIGGVGYFLVVTGIEVSARLDGKFEYTWAMLKELTAAETAPKWLTPLGLAVVLMGLERAFHHPLVLPLFFVGVFAVFHLLVWAVPSWSLVAARASGWVFDPPQTSENWHAFYSLYDFTAVSVPALLETIPSILALSFFGLLHVPINVPALAMATKMDDVDVDRELVAHGISNCLSGFLGSIQNYLVYTNSVLFIKSGANSRVAGVMLAMTTAGVMVAGPALIGYIPVMVVGALIFLLGFELMIEALVDTWGRLNRFEYFTLCAIVVTMGVWDFVYGILIGIILACVSFVVQASQTSAIKASYTGANARSTVRRHFTQQRFLTQVGHQIYVLKLSGYIFFGTITKVEKRVRDLLDERQFSREPIRYLIIDVAAVTDFDYSASEAFARMKRLLDQKCVYMLLSGAADAPGRDHAHKLRALKANNLLRDSDSDGERPVRVFSNLNMALEWSENEFLTRFYKQRDHYRMLSDGEIAPPGDLLTAPAPETAAAPKPPKHHQPPVPFRNPAEMMRTAETNRYGASPREHTVQRAAEDLAKEDVSSIWRYQKYDQPIPMMLQMFRDISDHDESFFMQVAPYFKRVELAAGTVLYASETRASGFYLVESGVLRADYDLRQGQLYESILAGTTCGELPFFSETTRTATVTAETKAVVWMLDRASWNRLKAAKPNGTQLANELLVLALKLTVERFTSVTAYVLMAAS